MAVLQLTEVPAIPFLWMAPIFALACLLRLLPGKGLSFQSAFRFGPTFGFVQIVHIFWKVESVISTC
jgi:hypothetical protein